MDYLPCMIFMMKQIENQMESINNVFPLRSEIAPKYIRLDTTTIVNLLFTKKQGNKGFYKTEGNLKKNEDKIWEFFFRTERKCFTKTGYSFHHMISTDGIGVSILFLQKELVGKKLPMMKKKIAKELYIDELTDYWHEMSVSAKRLVLFAPDVEPWTVVSSWENTVHYVSQAGNGLEKVDKDQILDAIANSI